MVLRDIPKLMDEPTSGLDGKNMELIANELRAAAAGGKTVIVITHDPELFEVCCEYKSKRKINQRLARREKLCHTIRV